MLKVWLEFFVHLVSCFILFLCWSLSFFKLCWGNLLSCYSNSYCFVPPFCSLLLLHVKLLSRGISRMVGLKLRVCECTVPGAIPAATSFLWLYINFVLSLFDCNFFPVLVFVFWSNLSLFWFVLKVFLIKFESILYSYKNHGHSGESAFSTNHPQSFPVSCAFLCCLDKCLLKIYLNSWHDIWLDTGKDWDSRQQKALTSQGFMNDDTGLGIWLLLSIYEWVAVDWRNSIYGLTSFRTE